MKGAERIWIDKDIADAAFSNKRSEEDIEYIRADLVKRKPMTDPEILKLAKGAGYDQPLEIMDFAIGFRFAETHHGIKREK